MCWCKDQRRREGEPRWSRSSRWLLADDRSTHWPAGQLPPGTGRDLQGLATKILPRPQGVFVSPTERERRAEAGGTQSTSQQERAHLDQGRLISWPGWPGTNSPRILPQRWLACRFASRLGACLRPVSPRVCMHWPGEHGPESCRTPWSRHYGFYSVHDRGNREREAESKHACFALLQVPRSQT